MSLSLDCLLTISNYAGWLSGVDGKMLTFDFPSSNVAREVFEKLGGFQPGYDMCRFHSTIDFYASGTVKCEGGSHI